MLVTFGRAQRAAAAGPGPAGGRGRRPGRRADRLRDGGSDPLVALLTDVPPDELSRRRGRVARALADFDAATIATTHEFCLQMLDGLGVLGDREPQAVFVEQVTDLTREVATDLYLRRYATWDSPPMTYPEAVEIRSGPWPPDTPGWFRRPTTASPATTPARSSRWHAEAAWRRSPSGCCPADCSPTTTC